MARDQDAPRHGKLWQREELILAFELHCRIPFGRCAATNPDVRNLAALLERSPGSVVRKLGNFGAFLLRNAPAVAEVLGREDEDYGVAG